jgi:hypothetical protein
MMLWWRGRCNKSRRMPAKGAHPTCRELMMQTSTDQVRLLERTTSFRVVTSYVAQCPYRLLPNLFRR